MDLKQHYHWMSALSLLLSSIALVVSLMSSFPGVKLLFVLVRDAVLWMALFFVVGIVAYVGYQRIEKLPTSAGNLDNQSRLERRSHLEGQSQQKIEFTPLLPEIEKS